MAGQDTTQDTASKAEKLRELFLAKHAADVGQGKYDDRDVAKFQNDDDFVVSFIRTYETMQVAADRIHDCLKFRLEFGVNDLSEDSFPLEIWEIGGAYYHNHDKDGLKILYLQVKQHKKDPQILPIIKKFFAYLLERQYQSNPDEEIVLLFDLYGAGLSHLDMDFIKYIITSFKVYYPKMLGYMLMYEMPWLFNAAWKIIKTWLPPEAVSRIKFVTKSDIQTYINKDQLWEHMGGTDTYVYKYEPAGSGSGDSDGSHAARKRVTFADTDRRDIYKSFSSDSIKDQGDAVVSNNRFQNNILQHTKPRGPAPAPGKRRASQEDNSFIGRLLTICPAEELEFIMENGTKEASDVIILKNTLPYPIAYKVKTTSPEKYRVRPSSGIVKAGSQVEVLIHLQEGYANTVHKDRFLIMAMEVANESRESYAELWKSVKQENIMEHRVRCTVTTSDDGDTDSTSTDNRTVTIASLSEKVDTLIQCNRRVERTVQIIMVLQALLFLFLLTVIGVSYFNSSQPEIDLEATWKKHCNKYT